MPNTNCLANMQCPQCDSDGPFRIEARASFLTFDTGTTAYEGVEWQEDSGCECAACHHRGSIADFTREKEGESSCRPLP